MGFNLANISLTSYFILILAVVLLALSITEIVLEDKVYQAFHNWQAQYPGSNLAEWLWVPLNPKNLDSGPTIAIIATGGLGIAAAVTALVWVIAIWWGLKLRWIRRLGFAALILAVFIMATSLAAMIYVFVAESAMQLPDMFMDWTKRTFTREFYLCVAFPSLIEDPDRYYGFPACDHAEVARYIIIALCAMSVILTTLCVVQLLRMWAFSKRGSRAKDIEKGVKASPKARRPSRTQAPNGAAPPTVQRPPPTVMPGKRSSLYGYYAQT